MTTAPAPESDFVIAHATSLLADDLSVFEHSVALAAASGSPLYTLHAVDGAHDIDEMPDAEALLTKWGEGKVSHHTIRHSCCDDPVSTLLDGLRMIDPDLLVVGKRQGSGLRELIRESISEALARNLNVPTIALPIGGDGFVDTRSGELKLERVLIPAEDEEAMLPAFTAINDLLDRTGLSDCEIVLLHIGPEDEDLALMVPETAANRQVSVVQRDGKLEDVIIEMAEELKASMIAMMTRGHDSLLDIARGSHTERVMRRASMPVMVIPIEE